MILELVMAAALSAPINRNTGAHNSFASCFCVRSQDDAATLNTYLDCVTAEHHSYKAREMYRDGVMVYWSMESDQLKKKPWPKLPIPEGCKIPAVKKK